MRSQKQLHKTIDRLRRWDTEDLRTLDESLHALLDARQHEEAAPVPVKAGRTIVEERQQDEVTLRLEYVRCGKESCHCAEDEGHGPYWYAYYRKKGRLTSQYIGKDVREFTLDSHLNGEKLMQEQETFIEQRGRKLHMIIAFRWYSGQANPPQLSPEQLETANALLLEQGCVERIEPRPQEPRKGYRLTSKGLALISKVNETHYRIRQRSLGLNLADPHPLDEVTYFD